MSGWPQACKDEIRAVEDKYDIEVVSIEHHEMWVDRAEAFEKVLKNLVAKIDDLTPDINGAIQLCAIHGHKWPADRNWVAELAAARSVLS